MTFQQRLKRLHLELSKIKALKQKKQKKAVLQIQTKIFSLT